MGVGMAGLGPLWRLAFPGITDRIDVMALIMATDMTVAMVAWMAFRKHSWPSIAEMAAAMFVPFLVMLVPYWFGAVSGGVVMIWGHALMMVAMLLAMLRRRDEYSGHHHHHRVAA